MAKRKKAKKKKPDPLPSLSEEQELHLRSLLENLKDLNASRILEQISTPELAQAFLSRLPTHDPDLVQVLLSLREAFPQKGVQKAIRKTIFRFKQKGISHPDFDQGRGAPIPLHGPEQMEPSAYLGPVDGSGSRGILLILPQIPKGVDVGMGAVSDEHGFIQFFFGTYSKKKMKEVEKIFFSSFEYAVETSLAHAATVLEKAYSVSEAGLNELSRDYLQVRPWILENVTLLEGPAIDDLVAPDQASEQGLTRSQIDKLLGHELMKTWIIDPEEIRPFMNGMQKVRESRILVSEAQKKEQLNEVKRKAVHEIYSREKRTLMKGRFEEMAYVFYKLEEEAMARLCLGAAQSLDGGDSSLFLNPVLEALVDRSLVYYMETAREVEESGSTPAESPSRIIIP